jgi:pilus assembly protein CpaC
MRKLCLSVILIVTALVITTFNTYAIDEIGEALKLYVGETKVIPVNNPVRVAISNPAIADVSNIGKSEMTIAGKTAGSTTLVFWDSFGEQSYKVNVFTEDLRDIKLRVDNLLKKLELPGVYSHAEESEGKVIILGKVKTPQERERVSTILGTLKDKTVDLIEVKEEETVIDIDVQVLELNNDATSTLGFTWPNSVTLTEVGSPGVAPLATKWSTLFKVLNLNRAAFAFTLDALAQEGKAQILSRPHLACQSGKEAELTVGGEKPVFTTQVSLGGSGTKVEYKEYGIKLKIKPTLTDEGRIKLGVNVEVSEVGDAETIGTTSTTENTTRARAYPLSKRTASTELYIDNGQTMIIGGLNKKKEEEDVRKVPGLGNVPIVGLAFRKKTTKSGGGTGNRGDSELFITLTPTITSMDENKSLQQPGKDKASEIKASTVMYEEGPVNPVNEYARIVKDRIFANFIYPKEAKENNYQGTVKISLHISYTGELLDVSMKESSGNNFLDDQAVSMAKNVDFYPPFPTSIENKELWIDIPVTFQLK